MITTKIRPETYVLDANDIKEAIAYWLGRDKETPIVYAISLLIDGIPFDDGSIKKITAMATKKEQ